MFVGVDAYIDPLGSILLWVIIGDLGFFLFYAFYLC